MASRVSVMSDLLVFCNSKCSDLENCARDLVVHENDGVRQVCLDAAKLCAAYKLKLSTGCLRIQEKLQALPELEAPSGQELEDFSAIGGETLEELRKLLKVSDSVNMDAKNLHLNICCGRYEQSKMKKDLEHSCEQKAEEIATRESVDAVLTFALAGCGVLTLFPLILYGATVTAVGATAAGCVGGVASFKFKRVQKHKISQAEAELNEKRKDAAKAEKSVVAYTQLDFFADPFSKGLVELEGHLRVLEGILDELLKCVNTEFRLAKTLRKKLDEELAYLPLRS